MELPLIVIQIPVSEKQEILIRRLLVNLLTNPSKLLVCIQCTSVPAGK